MPSVFEFKYADVEHKWKSVAVAGSFNEWSTERTNLAFDPSTKTWAKHVELDVSPMTKLYYKYVLNGQEWVLDESPNTQKETDEHGNVNNITFTVQQQVVPSNGEIRNGVESKLELSLGSDDSANYQETTTMQSPQEENVEVKGVDSKAQHSTSIEPVTNQQDPAVNNKSSFTEDVATPGLGETQNNELSVNLKDNQPELANTSETVGTGSWSFWRYIKWFFQYYIFSLFTSS